MEVEWPCNIDWFDDHGNRNVVRHECNQRNQKRTKAKYAGSIRRRGIVNGVRGEPWIVDKMPGVPPGTPNPYKAVSYGTL